jgi:protein TonB
MKNLLQSQGSNFDEILFQGRNKEYGAYAIRNEYRKTLVKATFSGITLFAVVAISPLIINTFKTPVEVSIPIGEGHTLTSVDIPELPPQTVKPVQAIPVQNTVKFEIPTPVRNPVKETPATKLSETEDARIGNETITGDIQINSHINSYIAPSETGSVPLTAPPVDPPKPVDNTPKTSVDISADFVGGINAFRNKVINNFNTSLMDGTGETVKTTVVFIVEKDGTITDVKASGSNAVFNREAEKTIKSVKGKWIPAKLDGKNVRSYFKFPISMQFE